MVSPVVVGAESFSEVTAGFSSLDCDFKMERRFLPFSSSCHGAGAGVLGGGEVGRDSLAAGNKYELLHANMNANENTP